MPRIVLAALAAAALAAAPPPYVDPAAVARLVRLLGSDDPDARRDAMRQLEKLGPGCLDGLRPALADPDPDVRLRAFVVRRAVLPPPAAAEVLLEGHTAGIICLGVSKDGRLAVTGGSDRTYRVWDLRAATALAVQDAGDAVWGASLTPDGKRALIGTQNGSLVLYDVATGKAAAAWPKYEKAVRSTRVLPDGKGAVTAHFDAFVRVHDLTAGKEKARLGGHAGGQLALAVSADGKFALTGGGQKDATARIWDLAANKEHAKLTGHGERILGVAFGPDGSLAATASWDGKVRVWDVRAGTLRETFDAGAAAKGHSVAFSPDGKLVAGGFDKGVIKLWALGKAEPRATLTGHTDTVTGLEFLPDGRLVSAGKDGKVRIWGRTHFVSR